MKLDLAYPELIAAAAVGVLLIAFSARWAPERRYALWLRGSLLFSGVLLAALLRMFGTMLSGTAALLLHELALLLIALSLLGVLVLFICRVLLRRIRPPVIVEHLLWLGLFIGYIISRLVANGIDLGSLVTSSAILTAAVALAGKESLGNLVAGIALQLESTIRVGDWVRHDKSVGKVIEIHWRSTMFETIYGERIVVPNAELLHSHVVVVGSHEGRPGPWRRHAVFLAPYDAHPDEVIAAVETGLKNAVIPGLSHDHPPHCIVLETEDSGVSYKAAYWLSDPAKYEEVDSRVRAHLLTALGRAGIRIPFPIRTLDLTINSERARAQRRAGKHAARATVLHAIDLFEPLEPDEIASLAGAAQHLRFADGDPIVREGERSRSLMVLTDGSADVFAGSSAVGGGKKVLVATVGAPAVFGELGLLTGEPRSATVIARGAAECLRIDESAMQPVLRARPQLAEQLSSLLAERQRDRVSVLEAASSDAAEVKVSTAAELLARIRGLFKLDHPPH